MEKTKGTFNIHGYFFKIIQVQLSFAYNDFAKSVTMKYQDFSHALQPILLSFWYRMTSATMSILKIYVNHVWFIPQYASEVTQI